jgi:hypothetical protein
MGRRPNRVRLATAVGLCLFGLLNLWNFFTLLLAHKPTGATFVLGFGVVLFTAGAALFFVKDE